MRSKRDVENTWTLLPEESIFTQRIREVETDVLFPETLLDLTQTFQKRDREKDVLHSFGGRPSHIEYRRGKPCRFMFHYQGEEGRPDFGPTDLIFSQEVTQEGKLVRAWFLSKNNIPGIDVSFSLGVHCTVLTLLNTPEVMFEAEHSGCGFGKGLELTLYSDNPWISPRQPNPPLAILLFACAQPEDSPAHTWGWAQATEEQRELLKEPYIIFDRVRGEGFLYITQSFHNGTPNRTLSLSVDGRSVLREPPTTET